MVDRTIVVCLDGCSPAYLDAADTPHLDALAASGWRADGRAVVPTVTNVNNVSIVTQTFPDRHGITANYYLDGALGRGVYMESADYVLAPTIFERLANEGMTSALLTAKDKLRTLLARGATWSASAEAPPTWLTEDVGPPPGIYSVDANLWLLDAALALFGARPELGFLYVSTTDYVMHRYSPDHAESQRHLHEIDRRLGRLAEAFDDANIAVTADHGMESKTSGIDAAKVLSEAGIEAQVIPIIKDRHIVHHGNLGGAAYVYLECAQSLEDARCRLREEPGIESVLDRLDAARIYHLHPGRIGDLMLLADSRTVFGQFPTARAEVSVRSHGSLHEQIVPIIGCGRGLTQQRPLHSKDLIAHLLPPHSKDVR